MRRGTASTPTTGSSTGTSTLQLGSTAHKQGRIAGTNALGGDATFAGSLGTQAVKVFDLVAAGTGPRDRAAREVGCDPVTVASTADDHKAYSPHTTPIQIRATGDRSTGRLLGSQLLGRHGAEIAKRIDIYATAISYGAAVGDIAELDMSYTPPLVAHGMPYRSPPRTGSAMSLNGRSHTSEHSPHSPAP
jgi:NADPH-dependent 2,4-dienoyl-CoA reductase/sulfur reductase-like enzyme